ncbi:MAG: type III-B CRISPR module RAMP protein Cmr6 [Phaeodactylibacter sp.]|nr:type III-B CRISPR module RAMP protein Cmr6 [Phaeodactylibacter sp.]MCB9298289.1 type III-B CRISPR module RAMP protein Cmr6 [Lewinellaceae bacterium]
MNLKHQFYRAYYEDIDLRKFEDKNSQEVVEKRNEPRFKSINESLFREVEIGKHPFLPAFKAQWGEEIQSCKLETTYPGLFLGSGYAHETGNVGEFKLGFHFGHTTGLPVLPGHSVKGALRSAFPGYEFNRQKAGLTPGPGKEEQEARAQFIAQLLGKEWPKQENESRKQLRALVHQLELVLFERMNIKETQEANGLPKYLPQNKWALYFDAHISRKDESKPEKRVVLGPDALTPHGENPLRNPIPLAFVKVLPKTGFTFAFRIPEVQLADHTFEAREIATAFEEILLTLGIGAKTNVGYGRLQKPGQKPKKPPRKPAAGQQAERPPVGKPEPTPQAIEPIELEKVRHGAEVQGEVADNKGGKITFKLDVIGYKEPVSVSYRASHLFEVGAKYKLKIKQVQGKGAKRKLFIDPPSPNDKID